MKLLKSIIAVLALGLAASVATAGEYPDMTIEELNQAIAAESVVILDANGSKSYANGHIPGAVDFRAVEDLSAVLPEDKGALVVAYCGGPRCGAYKKAAKAAEKLGYTNVKHLSAGINGWMDAGMEVEKAN